MRLVVDLTLPTDPRLIPRTRRLFTGYMDELGVDGNDAHDVVLALNEACTNVIRHAFPDDDSSFHLTAELSGDEVVLVVEDDGVGIAPATSGPEPDPPGTSGRGLQMIRRLMTSVEVETVPQRQGTRLHMRKVLRPTAVSAGS